MPSRNIVFLDTETGGLIAGRHSLLSIAMIVCDARYCAARKFETFVQHEEMVVTPQAMAKNRINLAAALEWPTRATVVEGILRFLGRPLDILKGRVDETDRWLIHGKNPQFDVQMLKDFMGEHVFNSTFLYYSRDIAETFMVCEDLGLVQMPRSLHLQDICVALGVAHDPNALHNAMYDTEMTLKCMQIMVAKLRSIGVQINGKANRAVAGAAPSIDSTPPGATHQASIVAPAASVAAQPVRRAVRSAPVPPAKKIP